MDGTPQLLTNIQFGEAKKGYDRDQVDKFLRELSVKVGELQDMLRETAQRAEAAELKLAEANKAVTQAGSLVEQAQAEAAAARAEAAAAPTATPTATNDVEAASGILAMAQKTADAAIEEAERKAKDVVADARAKAAMIVVEVEQDVERIRTEAANEAEAHVTERKSYAQAEVDRLTAKRDGLQAEADNLQLYLDEHRRMLRDEVASLTKLLESSDPVTQAKDDPSPEGPDDGGPGGGRPTEDDVEIDVDAAEAQAQATPPTATATAGAAPAMLFGDFEGPDASFRQVTFDDDTTEHAAVIIEPVVVDEPVIVEEPDTAPETDTEEPPAAPVELSIVTLEDLSEPATAVDDAKRAGDAEAEARAVQIPSLLEAPTPAAVTTPVEPAAPAAEPAAAPVPVAVPVAEVRPVTIAATGTDGASAPGRPTIDLTANALFAPASNEDESTQAYDVLGDEGLTDGPRLVLQRAPAPADDSSPLGEPDADADAAMRAFFEQDVDTVAKEAAKSGRFLRRK